MAAAWLALGLSGAASAQTLPALSGRVVDGANLLPPDREAALTARLEGLEQATSRQLVVVTVPDLQGVPLEDFSFQLGEAWKIGNKEADNGAILLVALAEKKIRIEVGDGLEPILTDAMSGLIIRDTMRPLFKAGDYPGGIDAGAGAIIEQLQAPPEVAEQKALEAAQRQRQASAASRSSGGGSIFPLIFWGIVLLFVILPMLRGGRRGRRYRRRGGGVFIWGPGFGGGGGGWGGGGGGFGGFGGGGGGGFGGFSGGGGSFGGGGASGGW